MQSSSTLELVFEMTKVMWITSKKTERVAMIIGVLDDNPEREISKGNYDPVLCVCV